MPICTITSGRGLLDSRTSIHPTAWKGCSRKSATSSNFHATPKIVHLRDAPSSILLQTQRHHAGQRSLTLLGLLGLHSEGSGFAGQNGKGGNSERGWVRWHSVGKSRLSARLHARHAVVYGAVVAERPAGLKGVVYGAVGVAATTKGAGG
jgi:hypothetical protein